MFLAVLLLFLSAGAWASCGSASCPVDTRSWQENHRGDIRLGYEFEFIDQNQSHISAHEASVGELRGHHDEQRTVNRVHRFTASAAVTDRLGLDIALPFVSRSHRHIHNHHGGVLPEGWDFSGVGDLAIRARYAVWKPEEKQHPAVSLIAGMEAPTGKTHMTNADGDEADAGITPGSDSWDFLAGFSTLQHMSVPMLGGEYGLLPVFFSLTHQWNGKGREDYRLGRVLTANAGVVYPLTSRAGFISQVNVLVKGKDDRGSTMEEIEKTGGEFLYVTPGLQFKPWDALELSALVQLPVYRRVNQIQLVSDYNLLFSMGYRFRIGS